MDAGSAIGQGHLTRCLALAGALAAAGARPVVATTTAVTAVGEPAVPHVVLGTRPGSEQDVAGTAALALARGARWVMTDGYSFDREYVTALRSHGLRVVFVDDNGAPASGLADLVINQNVHASPDMYPDIASDRLLVGPRFALLRREFADSHAENRLVPALACRILATLGGQTPAHAYAVVIDALMRSNVDGLDVRVLSEGRSTDRVQFVGPQRHVAPLMAWADLAIAGAGSTALELACMGLPAIVTVVADNQRLAAAALERLGVAIAAGPVEALKASVLSRLLEEIARDRSRRVSMSEAGRRLVDGHGCERVARALLERDTIAHRALSSP